MDYLHVCSSIFLCSFLATGCSTHKINQTNEVSTTAITYTNTVNGLLKVTSERVIEMDSKHLGMSYKGKDKKLKLMQKNDALEKWLHVADQLREQNVLLQKYFKALQAMVDSPLQNDMSDTLGSVSHSISEINDTQSIRRGKSSRNRVLNLNQTGYVSSLSKSLISKRYARKVRSALLRDKEIIAKQIELQAKQLNMISSIYKRRTRMDNQHHYANNVLGPFVSESPNNQFHIDSWAQSRLEWFNRKEALDIFADVQDANKAFSEAWINILQGKRDIGAVKAMLGDVNSFVRQAYQLRDSIKNPRVAYPVPYTNIQ